MTTPYSPAAMTVDLPTLWRGRRVLMMSVAVMLVLGGAFLLLARPTYQVNARLLVQQQGEPGKSARPVATGKDFVPTQAEIVASPIVVQEAVKSLRDVVPMDDERIAVLAILDKLKVDPLAGTNVLSVSYHHADADTAIRTIEAVIAAYREYLQSQERVKHGKMRDLLSQQEATLRRQLASLQLQHQQMLQQSPTVGQGKHAADVQRALLVELGEQIAGVRSRRVQLENELESLVRFDPPSPALVHATHTASISLVKNYLGIAAVAEGGTMSLGSVSPEPRPTLRTLTRLAKESSIQVQAPTALQESLLEARVQLRQLSLRYGRKHPDRIAAGERIAALEQQLAEMVAAMPAVLREELRAVRQHELRLGHLYQREMDKVKDIDTQVLQQQQALVELDSVQATHQEVLTQLKQRELAESAAAEGGTGVLVAVLEQPSLTQKQVKAPVVLVIAICTALGLLGGVIAITYIERKRALVPVTDACQ